MLSLITSDFLSQGYLLSVKRNILFVYAQYKQKLNQNQKWRIPVTYAHQTQTSKIQTSFVTRWKFRSEIHILPLSIQCRLKCISSLVYLPLSYNFFSLIYVLKKYMPIYYVIIFKLIIHIFLAQRFKVLLE